MLSADRTISVIVQNVRFDVSFVAAVFTNLPMRVFVVGICFFPDVLPARFHFPLDGIACGTNFIIKPSPAARSRFGIILPFAETMYMLFPFGQNNRLVGFIGINDYEISVFVVKNGFYSAPVVAVLAVRTNRFVFGLLAVDHPKTVRTYPYHRRSPVLSVFPVRSNRLVFGLLAVDYPKTVGAYLYHGRYAVLSVFAVFSRFALYSFIALIAFFALRALTGRHSQTHESNRA